MTKGKNTVGRSALNFLNCAIGLFVTAILVTVAIWLTPDDGSIPLRRGDYRVSVMLCVNDAEALRVVSDNPVSVKPGEDVTFKVEVGETYTVDDLPKELEYDASSGTVTLREVRFPTSLTLSARPKEKYFLSVTFDGANGSVTASHNLSEGIYEGTVVRIESTSKKGQVFVGYSEGDYIRNGGTAVCFTPEYDYTVSENKTLYVNYASEDSSLIVYNANGGTVAGSNSHIMTTDNSTKFYLCPNTLENKGYFKRDGYVLYGYNTEADGSGEYYGCGWNVNMHGEKIITLYAQWAKETPADDFTYTVKSGKVSLSRYKGTDSTVVIPQTIEGMPVTAINGGTFAASPLKTLILSPDITAVAAGTALACRSLESVYMFDKIVSMADNSFKDCVNLKTVYINAAISPKYANTVAGTHAIKFERLMTLSSPKLVVVAGSSTAFGLGSQQLETLLNNEYNVINYGTHAHTSAAFFHEVVSNFVGDGDVVIHAPEALAQQWGNNDMIPKTWEIFEGAYNAFSLVDVRNYDLFYSSFATFNKTRSTKKDLTYSTYTTSVNQYGEITYNTKAKPSDYSRDKDVDRFNLSIFTDDGIARLNGLFDRMQANGARVYITFAPTNYNALSALARTKAEQLRYENKARESYHAVTISSLADYILPGNLFYDSDYHLYTYGRQVRTDRLAKDIKEQFAKEKQ